VLSFDFVGPGVVNMSAHLFTFLRQSGERRDTQHRGACQHLTEEVATVGTPVWCMVHSFKNLRLSMVQPDMVKLPEEKWYKCKETGEVLIR
jgi:hypothetical protein